MRFNENKTIQCLNYLALKQPDGQINCMKAYKLLWLADRYHLRQFGRTITRDNYVAMKFGPVPSSTRDIVENDSNNNIKKIGKYKIQSVNPVDLDAFSQTDINALDLIFDAYGGKSQFELSEFSHTFPEWKRYEKDLENNNTSYPIDIGDFFENHSEALFNDDEDLLTMTKELSKEMR